jgi:hypothetical protein
MNRSDTRVKRERPERTGPIRNPLMPPPKVNGAASHDGGQPGSRPGWTSEGTLRDALECGVRTAYTVIDEYMRRGYEAARNNRDNQTEGGYMRDYRNYYSSGTNPWGWFASPMLPWMSLMRAWSDMLCAFTPGCMPPPMWNTACPGTASAPLPGVSVWVVTSREAKVTASINPGAECENLKCSSLTDAHGHEIEGVSIQSLQGMVCIHVPIKAEHTKGSYSGKIRTSDGSTVGSVNVVIE